jgi:hypothetical protein
MNKKQKCSLLSNVHKHILGSPSTLSICLMSAILLVLAIHLGLTGTVQVRAQTSEDEGLKDFVAKGPVNSTLYTLTGNWDAKGKWALTVSDGKLTQFDTVMTWNNGTSGHTHEFRNFVADDDDIEVSPDGTVSIKGEMDVGTNNAITWHTPAEIFINKGKIITVSVDDDDTNKHFGGQAIHGTVAALKPCSLTPGPDMQVPAGC